MWATEYIKVLHRGEAVQFRPRGHSMTGLINDGQLVTVEPVYPHNNKRGLVVLHTGDIVLCEVGRKQYLHLIKARAWDDGLDEYRYQIGNNKGGINGWVMLEDIHGVCTKVED